METSATKKLLRITEIRTLESITSNTLKDRKRKGYIREQDVQDVRLARHRCRVWTDNVNRMNEMNFMTNVIFPHLIKKVLEHC